MHIDIFWSIYGQGLKEARSFNSHLGPKHEKNWGPSIFVRAQICFPNIFHTTEIEINQHFQGPFGPLSYSCEGPHQFLRAICLRPALFQPLFMDYLDACNVCGCWVIVIFEKNSHIVNCFYKHILYFYYSNLSNINRSAAYDQGLAP